MISWGWLVSWSWLVSWLVLWVLSNTLVSHISNVARVSIINVVGYNLGTAIGKGNTVFTVGLVSVSALALAEVGTGVTISNSVLVLVDWGGISISWFLVSWGWVVWGWLISWSWSVWGIVGSSDSQEAKSNKGLWVRSNEQGIRNGYLERSMKQS